MAMRGRWIGRVGCFVALVVGLGPTLASVGAQDATPTAGDGPISVAASGLIYPRGFEWGPDGAMYVALAGSGDDGAAAEAPAVVRIEKGCGVPVTRGLPSTSDPYGDHQGPVDVGFIGEQLYVLQDAAGTIEDVGVNFPNGLYAANAEGGIRLVGDVTAYATANPPANVYHLLPLGEPFAMVGDTDVFWAVDANRGELLRLGLDGTVTRFADLSLNHPVPTAITLAPGGGVYVGFLGAAPHADGTSKIVKVTADGTATEVWSGLTMVSGVAVAPDGTLYALEMATGNTPEPPSIYPYTGRIVRQTGPASQEVVATGLNYPVHLEFGPDGGLYVSLPAIAADGELGGVARIDLGATPPVVMPPDLLANSSCPPLASVPAASPVVAPPGQTSPPPAVPAASPVAPAVTETPPSAATPTPAEAASNDAVPDPDAPKAQLGAEAVTIQNFAYNPPQIEVAVGTVVNWQNKDGLPHTATATGGEFDSGNLNPDQAFSFSFDTGGTYAYVCQYHPGMQGTVVVK